MKTASVILAAGRGSRMTGYDGNKALLPLVPGRTPYKGDHPILLHILRHLPPGPKALVVHHKKEEVCEATRGLELAYFEQPVLNGTGGGLLAARPFIEEQDCECLLLSMGDVPFVRRETYARLAKGLQGADMVVLSFQTPQKKRYGLLEIKNDRVRRIIEWEYWHRLPPGQQKGLSLCNAGIYAFKREALLSYLPVLSSRPHRVQKAVNGEIQMVEEYFITDLVEWMDHDGLRVGQVTVEREEDVMGIDDLEALQKAQVLYRSLAAEG